MVFSSPTFLFLFLPVFLLGYYATPRVHRSLWIVMGSWFFYGWWRVDFLLLLVGSSLGAAVVGRRIVAAATATVARRWLVSGVTVALALLGYFKYFNFGIDSLSMALAGLGLPPLAAPTVILPVGISFYTFQIISYLVDVYRGTSPAARTTTDVAAYVSLFPQLVAGPIVRYSEIADQIRRRTHSLDQFSRGVERFMLGLARKVLIADAVAPLADAVFGYGQPGFAGAWIGVLAYTVQIYFDFAAYSDMAIGMGHMMGFTFPENFRMPYQSASITEFWRRWHMTLSAWLRDYLFIPLGGSRRGHRRTQINLMLVMLLGGLWHGAAWTFVLWGAWHGAWLIRERATGAGNVSRSRGVVIDILWRLRTSLIVMVGWVLFRAPSFARAGEILRDMSGLGSIFGAGFGLTIPSELRWQFGNGALVALTVGILLVVIEPGLARIAGNGRRYSALRSALLVILFGVSVLRLMATSYSPFLYFQF